MEDIVTEQFVVTDAAALRVKELINENEEPDAEALAIGLRIYVQGGGCSGFNYGFEFITNINDDDIVIEKNDIKFAIDPMSIMYLNGAVLDFKKEAFSQYFTVSNPNASTTCGCGNSFAV